jgi:hypothetical protein
MISVDARVWLSGMKGNVNVIFPNGTINVIAM